jgi:hypothetical protein
MKRRLVLLLIRIRDPFPDPDPNPLARVSNEDFVVIGVNGSGRVPVPKIITDEFFPLVSTYFVLFF